MSRYVQKSYNWAYGAVAAGARMLPFLANDAQTKPVAEASRTIHQFVERLTLAAEEFRSLEAHLDLSLFGGAAMGVGEANGRLFAAIAESEAGHEKEARAEVRAACSKLSRVKTLLDAQSPIPYRHWFLNPWRYYPRRIGQALPSKGGLKKRDA
ncbi:MAG TPA: hypothetical protein VHE55_04790 [Fimbriimonadaceae bacterium]|nr:hypothetical protein [Fimbriimonadaceae bacterium]